MSSIMTILGIAKSEARYMATIDVGSAYLNADMSKEEREEALADVAIARSMEAIDSQLAGLTMDSSDEELKEAREARNRAKTRAEIKSELAGNDASLAENEYIQLAAESEASSQLDNMLNWGESDQEELSPAKLPE
jgi:phage shock protein A